MATIATIKESLDLLFVYTKEEHNKDLNKELEEIYKTSKNKAVYTVKQYGSSNTREEILEELKRRYKDLK